MGLEEGLDLGLDLRQVPQGHQVHQVHHTDQVALSVLCAGC